MGLFSSKKKTYVNTTVQPVFTENQIPNSLKTGVIKAILRDGNVPDYLLEETVNSINIRADAGWNWARWNYLYGTPSASISASASAKSVVMHTLASLNRVPVTPDYYVFGPMNSLHFGWQTLVTDYAYQPQTNELKALSASVGYPCYLKDMVATYRRSMFDDAVRHSDTGILNQWGPSPSSGYRPSAPFNLLTGIGQFAEHAVYEVSDTVTDDYITLTYEFKDNQGQIISRGLTVSMGTLDLDADYHQVRYVRGDGFIGFFTYLDGSGEYPEIDGVQHTPFQELGTYYPWTYLRLNDENMGADYKHQDQSYKDSVKWCKYLGVDYQTLSDAVQADPGVDDVEQAIMMFGVDANGQSQAELDYLFEYFSLLHQNSVQALETSDQFNAYSSSPGQAQVIRDSSFQMTLTHAGIQFKRTAGYIGKVGFCSGELLAETSEVTYQRVNSKDEAPGPATQTVVTPYYQYRKQVKGGFYEEVRVYNPSLSYQITDNYGHSAGAGDKELLIPVDRAVVASMSFRLREQVLARSLHIVVNTKVVVKTPWYASTWFKVVLIIIAIAIAIVSVGGASGISAAIATATVTSVTIAVVEMIVINLAVSYGLKLFVKAFGPEAGLIAAIALIAVGGYYATTTDTTASLSEVWGERLLSAGSNLAQVSTTEYGSMVSDIQQEMLDFQDYAKGEFDSLKEHREQLGLDKSTTALDFVSYAPMIVFGESPNDLYTRTVHSGNIGVVSYDMVSNFVGTSLTLPTLNQTEEGFKDGWTV
jgi:hypothetical protein